VTDDLSPYRADYSVYYVVVAASVWQSLLVDQHSPMMQNADVTSFLLPLLPNSWVSE